MVGIGNELRGDDGLGPLLMRRLKGKVGIPCLDAGSALENHLGRIVKESPDTVLLVDAVHLGLKAGDYRIVDPEEIEQAGLSTHDLSPGLALDFLRAETRGSLFLLGIQPGRLTLGSGISGSVRRSLRTLERRIAEAIHQ